MRRDFDIIRGILLAIGDNDIVNSDCLEEALNHTPEVLDYHLSLLINDARLLNGKPGKNMGPSHEPRWVRLALTWEGNDFLDAIGDEKVWKKVKKALSSGSKVATLETLKQVAKGVGAAGIGLILAEGAEGPKGQTTETVSGSPSTLPKAKSDT